MKLNFDQIKSVTRGAVSIGNERGAYQFYRFNKEEMEYYANTQFKVKSYATAGVEMEFSTDATELSLSGQMRVGSGRQYYCFDVLKNGELIYEYKNFDHKDMIPNYVAIECELGTLCGSCALGDGVKNVRIVFPWSSTVDLYDVELVGATFVTPVKRSKNMIIYGDSITQGYDAENSSRSYASRLALALDAEALNKGIGGERFIPELSAIKNDNSPDYITVAYGTNGWAKYANGEDASCAEGFYENLAKNYPDAKIFAIAPIFRDDVRRNAEDKDFAKVAELIRDIADKYDNVYYIDGIDLVGHDSALFADKYLHPSNVGFDQYAENLINKIKTFL